MKKDKTNQDEQLLELIEKSNKSIDQYGNFFSQINQWADAELSWQAEHPDECANNYNKRSAGFTGSIQTHGIEQIIETLADSRNYFKEVVYPQCTQSVQYERACSNLVQVAFINIQIDRLMYLNQQLYKRAAEFSNVAQCVGYQSEIVEKLQTLSQPIPQAQMLEEYVELFYKLYNTPKSLYEGRYNRSKESINALHDYVYEKESFKQHQLDMENNVAETLETYAKAKSGLKQVFMMPMVKVMSDALYDYQDLATPKIDALIDYKQKFKYDFKFEDEKQVTKDIKWIIEKQLDILKLIKEFCENAGNESDKKNGEPSNVMQLYNELVDKNQDLAFEYQRFNLLKTPQEENQADRSQPTEE